MTLNHGSRPAPGWAGRSRSRPPPCTARPGSRRSRPTNILRKVMRRGEVAVIAGFQGVSPEGRITTLGRGGSDTTRSPSRRPSKAERCDIYTDVDGVYTTDPRIVRQGPQARQDRLRGDAGDGVARRQGAADPLGRAGHGTSVPLRVLSSFERPARGGTFVCDEEDIMEKKAVTGVAYSRDEAKITLHRCRTIPASPRRSSGRWPMPG